MTYFGTRFALTEHDSSDKNIVKSGAGLYI